MLRSRPCSKSLHQIIQLNPQYVDILKITNIMTLKHSYIKYLTQSISAQELIGCANGAPASWLLMM